MMRVLAAGAVLVGLAGCAALETSTENRASVLENGVFGDIRARHPKAGGREPQGLIPVDTTTGTSLIYGPDGQTPVAAAYSDSPEGEGEAGEPGSYRLNFENAEIKDVVHAVLGEALKLNYTLTPDVAGTITISSARPVNRTELLSILETTLAAQGFSMVKTGEVWKVGAIVSGGGVVDRGARTQPGYGVSIVPLRFVSVRNMGRLLGGFVIDAEGIRIDSTRNTMVISGPGSKREEVVATILSFDEDWMKDQTVGIFEMRRANPAAVVPELERVFDAAGAGSGVITFRPITRLKAVMVVSRNADLVRRAETWVQRLDRESLSGGEQMYVYQARHRDAKELARIANGLFAGGSLNLSAATPSADRAFGGDDGFSIGEDADAEGFEEQPIDDVTGAGEDGFEDETAPPDVIDLTASASGGGRAAVKIAADPANNSVIIYGDAAIYRKVLAAIQQLDVAPVQVAINVTIAEVRLNDALKYGIQYFVKSGSVGLGEDEGSISFKDVAGALSKQIPGFNFLIGSDKNPDVIVSALDRVTDVEILSSPSLVVVENQKATLQVGDQIPVQVAEQSTDGGTLITQTEYRDTGIILNVTPRVGEDGTVTMLVEQEISSVPETSPGGNPTISRRRVASNIAVNDGQTVVLAGLISSTKETRREGVPLLSRLAGVGDAFANNNKGTIRNELVVLIRPQIVRNGEDAQSVAEDLRSKLWAIGQRERRSP